MERIFRTIRDGFLRPLDKESVRSLADLNARFHTWLETEYHRSFTLDGVLYEVPVVLKGKNIKVRFNPFQLPRTLELLYEKRSYGQARVVDAYANTRVKRTHRNDLDSGLSPSQQAGRPPKHPPTSPTRAALSASTVDLSKGDAS